MNTFWHFFFFSWLFPCVIHAGFSHFMYDLLGAAAFDTVRTTLFSFFHVTQICITKGICMHKIHFLYIHDWSSKIRINPSYIINVIMSYSSFILLSSLITCTVWQYFRSFLSKWLLWKHWKKEKKFWIMFFPCINHLKTETFCSYLICWGFFPCGCNQFLCLSHTSPELYFIEYFTEWKT